ncbi:MAG: hypothetical protein ACI3ZY_14925 [Parabacteroides sp.]
MKRSIIILMLASAGIVAGCSSSRESAQRETAQAVPMTQNSQQIVAATPKVIIYKMRKDYSSHVPVTLSADRKRIVAYPAISDIQIGGRFTYPTALLKGWWLDNRGISRYVAFLTYTYEEYAALPATPVPSVLMEHILDSDPLTDMRFMGNRYQYKDLVDELNEKIKNGL